MSGRVVVDGNASQSAGATGRGGLLVVHGDASSRCGISMKGIDIVVGGSVGHMSAFMAQTGCLVVCGDAGDALGDSIYEARLYVRGSVGPRRGLRGEGAASRARRASRSSARRRRDRCRPGGVPATGPRGSSTTSRSTTLAPTESWPSGLEPWNLRESYLFDRTAIAEIQRAAREGIYDIRGFGAKRRLHFDDLLFLGASISRYPLEGYRGVRDRRRPRHASRRSLSS